MNLARAAVAAAAAAVCGLAPQAQADPVGQPDIPPAPSGVGNPLAQAGSPVAGPLGLPDLSAYPGALLLGQNPAPAPPTPHGPAVLPPLGGLAPEYLLPQNVSPAAPGVGVAAPGLAPSADIPGNGRIALLRRLHEMYRAGLLSGALLGQNPPGELPRQPEPGAPTGQPPG